MGFKPEKIIKALRSNYSGITFTAKDDGDSVIVSADLSSEEFDDSIYFSVEIFSNKVIIIDFIFDKIEKNLDSYELINKFNEESYFLKASISTRGDHDENFLRFSAKVMNSVNEEIAYDNIDFALGQILDENLLPTIKALCSLTH